jgi:hypothetical protein
MPTVSSSAPQTPNPDGIGNGNGNGNCSAAVTALAATLRTMRQLFILLIGLTVLLIGIVMIVLPGPSILVIPLGLAILGIEFAWARRWLAKFKSYLPKRKPKANPTTGALPPSTPPEPEVPSSALPSSSVESR